MQKEGRTDMTKPIVILRNFANAPKNSTFCPHSVLYWFQNKQRLFPYTALTDWFLGAHEKLRKATICFVMLVNLSVLPHGTIRLPLDGFSWSLMRILRKSVEKIQVSLNMTRTAINVQEYICIFMTLRLISVITVTKCSLRGTTWVQFCSNA